MTEDRMFMYYGYPNTAYDRIYEIVSEIKSVPKDSKGKENLYKKVSKEITDVVMTGVDHDCELIKALFYV